MRYQSCAQKFEKRTLVFIKNHQFPLFSLNLSDFHLCIVLILL